MSEKEKVTLDEESLDEIQKDNCHPPSEGSAKTDEPSLLSHISKLEGELDQASSNLNDVQLRFHAEIDNIRRRSELDVEKAHKFSLEKFASELLPVIDSLERALDATDQSNPNLQTTIEGIDLTLKSLLSVMHKFGVRVVNEAGVLLDPSVHQAVSLLVSEELEPNHILSVLQSGYTLNGRLLRAAMVTVSKRKGIDQK
jgi:molecular chaperone GrpE